MLGDVNTPSEQEADQIAKQTTNHGQAINTPTPVSGAMTPVLPETERTINQAKGGGQSLPQHTQSQMSQALGTNLSGVRVHTDSRADNLNQALQAKAFTTGQDIFFRQGAYRPDSSGGQQLLAHELTHVAQQNNANIQPNSSTPPIQRTVVAAVDNIDSEITQKFHKAAKDYASAAYKLKVLKTPIPPNVEGELVKYIATVQHIDFAVNNDGGPVIDFTDTTELQKIKDTEHFFMVEHGDKGTIGTKSPKDVVDFLDAQLPGTYKGEFDISSCQAGLDVGGKDTSLVAEVAKKLGAKGRKGIKVRGGIGNTFTHRQFNDEYFATAPGNYSAVNKLGDKSLMQTDLTPYIGKMAKTKTKDLPSITEIGENVAGGTERFYKDLIKKAKTNGLLELKPYVTYTS